jgi:hypothetical protein
MKTIFNFLLAGSLLLFGCSGPKSVIETVPVGASGSELQAGYVYALPQTTFKVTVDLVKTRTIRGPYYRFAEKYLSIRDAPDRNSTSWRIDRINLKSMEEADPDQMYMVRQVSGEQDLSTLMKLSQQGLIYDFNMGRYQETRRFMAATGDKNERFVYTDLTERPNIVMSIDTSYKSIKMDSTFVKVPVTSRQLIVKTIDEKAQEAAKVLLKIRRKRVNVLTGKGEIPLSDAGIQRLDELEEEYLALFIGKDIEERKRFTLYVTPSTGEVFEHQELFEFSTSQGILSQHMDNSAVVSLTIQRQREVERLNNYGLGEQLPMQTNALYYRVPDRAEVQISIGDDILLMERVGVYQYGTILSMPVSLAGR